MSSSMLSALCKNAWFGSTDQAVAAGISWQAHMDSCHMVGTGIIPSIKSKEIASFFKSTPLPHLYLFLSYSFFPAFAPLQTKLFPRPEITWSLCRSDSRVCEDEILWLFFFSSFSFNQPQCIGSSDRCCITPVKAHFCKTKNGNSLGKWSYFTRWCWRKMETVLALKWFHQF